MFDTENLRPVVVGMVFYVLLVNLIPKVFTKPTGIKILDDLVLFVMANRDSLTPGAIVAGIVVFAANYINTQVL